MFRYVILLIVISVNSYGQKMKPFSFYLANPKVSASSKTFYKKLPAIEKDQHYTVLPYLEAHVKGIYSFLDSINTKNSITRPFYLYLLCRYSEHADGADQEGVLETEMNFIHDKPAAFFQFMLDNPALKLKYFDSWFTCVDDWVPQRCTINDGYDYREPRCKAKYRDEVMHLLENENEALKNLATEFFNKMY